MKLFDGSTVLRDSISRGFASVVPWFGLIPILFIINAGFGLAHHHLWFDEAQSWSLVRDSPTVASLFHNLRYEGHPGLWYLILWGAQRFTLNPVAMKICHGLIAAGAIGLIGYFSPFRKRDRILLMAGYFLMFEYVVISRNYGIGMFLGFLYACIETRYPQKKHYLYLILGLLANCNAFTFLFSGVLTLSRFLRNDAGKSFGERLRDEGWGVCCYIVLAGFAAWTMSPPADMAYSGMGSASIGTSLPAGVEHFSHSIKNLISVLAQISYIMPDSSDLGPFARLAHDPSSVWIELAAMGFTLAPFFILFPKRPLFHIFVLTFLVSFIFCFIFYQTPGYRHVGIFWLCFVVCYWIKCAQDRQGSNLASLYFAMGALWGVYSTVQAYQSNSSNAEAAAAWVGEHDLQQAFWISYGDMSGVALSAFLGIPTYSPDCRCVHKHVVWNNQRRGIAPDDVGKNLLPVMAPLPGHIAYLISIDINDQKLLRDGLGEAGIRYDVLQTFSGTSFDNYTLYKLVGPDR